MELFTSEDVSKIFWKKLVVVIGDSIQRCVYKDLVCLLSPGSNTRYLTSKELKAKGEIDFLNDKLLQGGQLGEVKTGINYREVRQYDNGTSVVKFYFATRCYSDHLESVLNELKTMQPHAVIMNSCLWDLHRYGPRGPDSYHVNMKKLMVGLKKVIPSDAVFIWNATLPLDSKCKGGFLLPYYENIPAQEIIEANFIAADIVRSYGFIFLDLHSLFVHQLYHRAKDGIHWNHFAHRRISNLILLHLCRAWNLPVPKTMPLDIPREPRLQPLAERPRNASFGSYTSELHIDRYGFNSSGDARYVVQKPNTYKDRFRLMGSPIIISSTTVSKDNQMPSPVIPGLTSDVNKESEPFAKPIYASSPMETVSMTKSLLQQNESTTTLDSPLTERYIDQKLGLSQNLEQDFNACSGASKNATSYFSDTNGTQTNEGGENTLTGKGLTSTASQSSSLVIQVLSTCIASKEKDSVVEIQPTTCTSSINPALSSHNHVSQMNLPVLPVTSQVTMMNPSPVTKMTSYYDKQSNVAAPSNKVALPTSHRSQLTIPVNQVASSQVAKTTASINQHNAICASVYIPPASLAGHAPSLSTPVMSSVTKTTQCLGKENALCTTGNSIPLLANVSQLRKYDLPNKKQACSRITTVHAPQRTSNIPVIINQEASTLNTQIQKELHVVKSSVDSVVQTKEQLRVGGSTVDQNKPSKINDVFESSKVQNKTKHPVPSTKRKAPVKDLEHKASMDVQPKKQKLAESALSNTSGKSHSEAKKSFSGRASSTKLSEVSSGGQKRKTTGDEASSRITKQHKVSEVKKKADDSRKPSGNLKRKAPTEAAANENKNLPHHDLKPPPVKRGKNERDSSTTSRQYPMRNALPLSGQHSTSSSTCHASIPVYSGNRIETNVLPQRQCVPSYNFVQSNCYWTESQQSLQDIQQQQQWFNTLLSRGRAGPYMNNAQPLFYYNHYTRSWQINQGYYYSNNYRY